MDHKTLTIVPIVVSLAVILLLGANIGLIGSVSGKQPADPTNFGPKCVGCITTQNVANGAITNPKIANNSVNSTQLQSGVIPHVPSITRITVPAGKDGWNQVMVQIQVLDKFLQYLVV